MNILQRLQKVRPTSLFATCQQILNDLFAQGPMTKEELEIVLNASPFSDLDESTQKRLGLGAVIRKETKKLRSKRKNPTFRTITLKKFFGKYPKEYSEFEKRTISLLSQREGTPSSLIRDRLNQYLDSTEYSFRLTSDDALQVLKRLENNKFTSRTGETLGTLWYATPEGGKHVSELEYQRM